MKLKRKLKKEELLFEVNDTRKAKLGKDLHIPMIDSSDGFDWSVESLLVAIEIALKKGFDLPHMPHELLSFEYSYYCSIKLIL